MTALIHDLVGRPTAETQKTARLEIGGGNWPERLNVIWSPDRRLIIV
jgi:hypothetical protein